MQSDPREVRHLFVYGTLMRAAGAASIGVSERQQLHRASHNLGPATMPGRLYDRGRYPAMVEPLGPADLVQGELLELTDPEAIFALLDPYEGVDRAAPQAGEYYRAVRSARSADGVVHAAWVYLYQGNVDGLSLVRGGRWRP